MNVPDNYVSSEEARRFLKVTSNTLRTWAIQGKIQYFRTGGVKSHRYYNIREFLEKSGTTPITSQSVKKKICYCRVSTRNQKEDLERQKKYLISRFPDHEIISDIGSGINFNRKGLKTILDSAIKGNIDEVVVAYKDRLCRFGFDLIKYIIEKHSNGKIVVLNNPTHSREEEVVSDVLSILNVFSARINGLRKYHSTIKEDFKTTDKFQEQESIEE
jgi:predicted site-specific integrase-resolvase